MQAGTPAYAAPEVYNRQPMSFPVDVWSLGCILHELCALQPAFDGISVRRLRGQVGRSMGTERGGRSATFCACIGQHLLHR